MMAAVLYGKEHLQVEPVPVPTLAEGDILVRVRVALTCGTDVKVFKRGYHARMIVPPAVFGHELAGVVSEIRSPKSKVRNWEWRVGDRVVAANSAPCGNCFFCQRGQDNLCDDLLFLNGAYAESIVVPARLVEKNLLRLEPKTSFRDAALTEPLACVVQGVEDLKLRAGQRVLVIGAGPIGLMFVAVAKHRGCAVSVAGRGEQRLRTARRSGAEEIIDVGGKAGLVEAVRAESDSGFDVVVETVGKPETWEAAVQ